MAGAGDPLASLEAVVEQAIEPPAPAPLVAREIVEEIKADDTDIRPLLVRCNNIAEKILDNFDDDRNEIEQTIDQLRDMFQSTPKPQSHIVEGLVTALKTKAELNTNIVKILDAHARLITALKGTTMIQGNVTKIDLSSLLESTINDDDNK